MDIFSENIIFHALAFLSPGFISYSSFSFFVPTSEKYEKISMIKIITWGCLNFALWGWYLFYQLSTNIYNIMSFGSIITILMLVFILPAALGIVIGILSQRKLMERFLEHTDIAIYSPLKTSWDNFFQSKSIKWVLITLKDGSQVAGYYGTESFASTDPEDRDIFIEDVYDVEDDGSWNRIPGNSGILIKGVEIRHIEFWDVQE